MYRAVQLSAALQVYQQKELQKTTVHTNNVNQLLEKTGLRSGAFDTMFPTMFSLHGLDIREALEESVKTKVITENAKNYAIIGINNAIHFLATKRSYPVLTQAKFAEIEATLQQFADLLYAFANQPIETISPSIIADMKRLLEKVKKDFSKPYIVSYYQGDDTRVASVKILHNSFKNLRDSIVNPVIRKEVLAVLKEKKVTNSILISNPNYITSEVINWGHTQTEDSIISGKLIASLMSLSRATASISAEDRDDAFKLITQDFLQETGQEKVEIKLSTGELTLGETEVQSLVIRSEFIQKVKVQNKAYNQIILGQAEKKWSLLDAVERKNLLGVFGVTSIEALASKLLNTRSSLTPVEKIGKMMAESIAGQKLTKTAKNTTLLNKTSKKVEKRKKVSVVSKSTRMRQDAGKGLVVSETSLDILLSLLNANLTQKIKENMGDGLRRDVLNLRTGRFAESVKVERLSESRAGMITAFYSYMKNPYATFSDGGAQSSPRSRDPKLLISKSIHEIAQQQVANRLRAVNV